MNLASGNALHFNVQGFLFLVRGIEVVSDAFLLPRLDVVAFLPEMLGDKIDSRFLNLAIIFNGSESSALW